MCLYTPHKEHEKAHAQIFDKHGLSYKHYQSEDGLIACTVVDGEEFREYATSLTTEKFINFLLESHNPPQAVNFEMDGTDKMVYMILKGELGEEELLAYIVGRAS